MHDTGALQVQSHFGGEYERKAPGGPILRPITLSEWGKPYERPGHWKENFYLPFIEALLETGYRGCIGYELCCTLPVIDGKTSISSTTMHVSRWNSFENQSLKRSGA